jgi:hypothetical protein
MVLYRIFFNDSVAQCSVVNRKKRQAQESMEQTKENTMKWFQPCFSEFSTTRSTNARDSHILIEPMDNHQFVLDGPVTQIGQKQKT